MSSQAAWLGAGRARTAREPAGLRTVPAHGPPPARARCSRPSPRSPQAPALPGRERPGPTSRTCRGQGHRSRTRGGPAWDSSSKRFARESRTLSTTAENGPRGVLEPARRSGVSSHASSTNLNAEVALPCRGREGRPHPRLIEVSGDPKALDEVAPARRVAWHEGHVTNNPATGMSAGDMVAGGHVSMRAQDSCSNAHRKQVWSAGFPGPRTRGSAEFCATGLGARPTGAPALGLPVSSGRRG